MRVFLMAWGFALEGATCRELEDKNAAGAAFLPQEAKFCRLAREATATKARLRKRVTDARFASEKACLPS